MYKVIKIRDNPIKFNMFLKVLSDNRQNNKNIINSIYGIDILTSMKDISEYYDTESILMPCDLIIFAIDECYIEDHYDPQLLYFVQFDMYTRKWTKKLDIIVDGQCYALSKYGVLIAEIGDENVRRP